ncbi:MAG TPA: DUF2752 domain-containing protein [Thermoanaerobaculia bacterium]|nr:DUF2752 domain-containing protein [Thermoanaerobaculia bacterium]
MREDGAANRVLGLYWGAVAVGLLLASPLVPRASGLVPPCPFRSLTGLPCPTCGSTRALTALARLDPVAAWISNPLVTMGLIAFVAGGLIAGLAALVGRPLPEPKRFPPAVRATAWFAALFNWLWVLIHFRLG